MIPLITLAFNDSSCKPHSTAGVLQLHTLPFCCARITCRRGKAACDAQRLPKACCTNADSAGYLKVGRKPPVCDGAADVVVTQPQNAQAVRKAPPCRWDCAIQSKMIQLPEAEEETEEEEEKQPQFTKCTPPLREAALHYTAS